MKALGLYTRYALRSFARGRSRSFFGAFCVAVGIASVVALGLVGGNFRDAVSGNAQKLNRGDVSIVFNGQGISRGDYQYFARLKAQGKIKDYTPLLAADAMIKETGTGNGVVIGAAEGVDPAKFPFYDTVKGIRPAGVPLKSLLSHPNDAVVPQTTFDSLHLRIGGPVSVVYRYGGRHTYTVRGIVPDNAVDPGFGTGLFPYWAMVGVQSMASYSRANDVAAQNVYMTTTDQAQANGVKADLQKRFGPLVSPKTIVDVEKDSKNGADGMDKFFRIMGLVAVIIGGIGIINTMLVAARRRLREIAVLKAIGMKGRQVILVFTIESFFLAVAGTAGGVALGILASVIVNNITQSLAGYPIPWSLHAGPLVAGLLVGIVATLLFSYLPVLRASRARPVASLRGDMGAEAKVGRFRRYMQTDGDRSWLVSGLRALAFPFVMVAGGVVSFVGALRHPIVSLRAVYRSAGVRTAVVVLALAALMGYLAVLYTGLASGAQTVQMGIIAGIGTLIGAGVLIQLFVGLIWLVSKLPTFGRLSTRMAFRSMSTQKRRLASTLLALCVGILSIGTIVIQAQNIKHELATGLEKRNNYNVSVQFPHNATVQARVNRAIASLGSDVKHRYDGAVANTATLASVDGRPLSALIQEALTVKNKDGSAKYGKDTLAQSIQDTRGLAGEDRRARADQFLMEKGRNLGPRDVGTNHIVVAQDIADPFGITLGSRVVFADHHHLIPFTVVGILSSNNFSIMSNNLVDLGYMQRVGLTMPMPDHLATVYLDIPHGPRYTRDLVTLRTAAGGFVLDLDSFLEFTKVIDKLALFPEIIAGLSLFAGAIIIANTVALAMLERRREIGVMKAVGARRRTVLQFLLVENAVVGLIGSAAGVALAMFAAYFINTNVFQFPITYDWTTILGLLGLGTALAVAASALTALPASSEKPLTVLRYE